MTPVTVITPPAVDAITLAELKAQVYLGDDDVHQDALIFGHIDAAIADCESFTGRSLITRQYRIHLDEFPPVILLPRPPTVSVEAVKYVDSGGTEQTMAPADYQLDTASEPARLCPAYGKSWPDTRRQLNAVTVEFTAGYGDDPASVPAGLRQGIIQKAATLFGEGGREDLVRADMRDSPADALYWWRPFITPYK